MNDLALTVATMFLLAYAAIGLLMLISLLLCMLDNVNWSSYRRGWDRLWDALWRGR